MFPPRLLSPSSDSNFPVALVRFGANIGALELIFGDFSIYACASKL